jgi:thioredoxin reductase (NADPH)
VDRLDCIIVGAGPAGLSAALYMARFHRSVQVLHDGRSRALRIPRTHNVPGFPDGVAGPVLVDRMTGHATRYGAHVAEAEVVSARHDGDGFTLGDAGGRTWQARTLILATGLHLEQVPLDDEVHEAAIAAGVLRYCPICDGHEHTGQRIGVIGCDTQGAAEALFLRQYTDDITLVPRAHAELAADELARLADAGVRVVAAAATRYVPRGDRFEVHVQGRDDPYAFDVVYPALGCRQRTELARMLGLPLDAHGCTDARSPFGTDVPGLYCIGDIVDGLDQISVAMGHGAIAATRAHNWLRTQDGHALPDRAGDGADDGRAPAAGEARAG